MSGSLLRINGGKVETRKCGRSTFASCFKCLPGFVESAPTITSTLTDPTEQKHFFNGR
jgi:hypothetical protein